MSPQSLRPRTPRADLVTEWREALPDRDHPRLGRLVDEDFDVRASICKLDPET